MLNWKLLKQFFFRVEKNNLYKSKYILGIRFYHKKRPDIAFSKSVVKTYTPNIKNIGKCSYSQPDLYIASIDTKIGSFCSIGPRVVLGHGEHPMNYVTTSPFLYFMNLGYKKDNMPSHDEFWILEPIEIGNDVWIGDGAFIKNGITIGDGAMIGARAVVTKDVPPYAIVAGIPAKIMRYRFDEKTIAELLELKWWDLDDEIIQKIPYDNIEASLKFLKEVVKK